MFEITVPASSANIGPGFDSVGVAVGRYLTLTVKEHDKWSFIHTTPLIPPVRHYIDHYIYKVATEVGKRYNCAIPPCEVTMHTEIPLARGLGSSASAIVAGVELTNQLCKLELTLEEKLNLAVEIEGHPDNVAPAIFGGFVVTVQIGEKTSYKNLPTVETDLVVYIPNFELKTEESRNVLPKSFKMKDAATASGISNLMISSLLTGDYKLAGQMMESDLFHESYRSILIPHYMDIKSDARKLGAFGTVISGAGPTMISFVPKGEGKFIADEMSTYHPSLEIEALKLDHDGLKVKNLNLEK